MWYSYTPTWFEQQSSQWSLKTTTYKKMTLYVNFQMMQLLFQGQDL